MPSYTERDGKVRASLCVGYKRETKTFNSLEKAKLWAEARETLLRGQLARFGTQSAPLLASVLSPRLLQALADTHHTHNEIVEGSIPFPPGRGGVYFLICQKEVVYVGQSKDVLSRIGRHRKERMIDFDSFNYILCDEDTADRLEEAYTVALMPKMNRLIGVQAAHLARRKLHTPVAHGANSHR